MTLPACSFASRARRYLPSPAYFAYASIAHHALHLAQVQGHIDKSLEAMPASASLKKLRKMAGDHHDATIDMHKTHHAEIHGSTSQQHARQVATEHLATTLGHHVDYFDKAFAQCDQAQTQKVAGTQVEIPSASGQDATQMVKDLAKTISTHVDVSGLFVHAAPLAKVPFGFRDMERLGRPSRSAGPMGAAKRCASWQSPARKRFGREDSIRADAATPCAVIRASKQHPAAEQLGACLPPFFRDRT